MSDFFLKPLPHTLITPGELGTMAPLLVDRAPSLFHALGKRAERIESFDDAIKFYHVVHGAALAAECIQEPGFRFPYTSLGRQLHDAASQIHNRILASIPQLSTEV